MWKADTSMRSLFQPLGLGGSDRPGGAVEASIERPQKSNTPPSSMWSHTNTSDKKSLPHTRYKGRGSEGGLNECLSRSPLH